MPFLPEGSSRCGFKTGTSFLYAILLAEAIYTPSGVHEFLFSGKERVTGRTNFHLDVLYRRTGLNDITARARDRRQLVLWMYAALHRALLACRPCMPENRLDDGGWFPATIRNRPEAYSLSAGRPHYSWFWSSCQSAARLLPDHPSGLKPFSVSKSSAVRQTAGATLLSACSIF